MHGCRKPHALQWNLARLFVHRKGFHLPPLTRHGLVQGAIDAQKTPSLTIFPILIYRTKAITQQNICSHLPERTFLIWPEELHHIIQPEKTGASGKQGTYSHCFRLRINHTGCELLCSHLSVTCAAQAASLAFYNPNKELLMLILIGVIKKAGAPTLALCYAKCSPNTDQMMTPSKVREKIFLLL